MKRQLRADQRPAELRRQRGVKIISPAWPRR
jgi:hypothetical protein